MMRKILAVLMFILMWVIGSALMDFYLQFDSRPWIMLYGVVIFWVSIIAAKTIVPNY